jgi:RND superfamily putative drug exporter
MVVGLGLGLAIDYSLFILSRYREELAVCGPGIEPLRRTLATAGRTVLFSATTVGGALLSLMAFPQRFLTSMGIGGVICTAVAATTALVALPALIAVLGPRVNALAPGFMQQASERAARGEERGFWYRLSYGVMRRPLPIALACSGVLIAAGLPFLNVKFTGVDASVLPTTSEVRQVSDTLENDFTEDPQSPISLAVDAPRNAGEKLDDYVADLEKLPNVDAVSAPDRLSDDLWQIDVTPAHDSFDDRTQDLVKRIRADDAPFPVATAGEAAAFADQQASLKEKLPIALSTLIGITLVVLFLLTGSIVLPVKSVLMNFLGLSATFGLLVLIFQEGHLEGVLNFQSEGALNATQPILLFIVAFGLSTDYGVFLLTRIKEQHDLGAPNREAVATGLQRTGRIVTAAALLFSFALGAFATSEIVFIKLVGVGAVLAVLIDSSIIRALLVPALMAMLGTRNWWAPRPLRRVYERFGISEG